MRAMNQQLNPDVLIYSLPQLVVEQTMERMQCFRTEVRSTGDFICGVHRSARLWKKPDGECPDAVEASMIAADALWMLMSELEMLDEDDPFKDVPPAS